MSALNPNDYVYLWHPALQVLDKNGKPLVNGYVMVNISDTTGIHAQTYADWNGTENAKKIMLDSLGRAVCIVSDDYRYDMYVYNKYNALEYSALNLSGSGEGGSSNLHFSSSDGSIIINRSGDHVDLRVNTDPKTFGIITGSGLNQDGSIDFDTTKSGNIDVQEGSLTLEPGMLYHVTLELKFENSSVSDEYAECEILDAAAIRHKFTLDTSRELEYKELSWDLTAINEYAKFVATIPESYSITDAKLYIHKVNSLTVSGNGDATYEAGTGISIVENTISVDTSVVPLKTDLSTVAFSGSYNDLTDKPMIPGQVQSDWTETDTSASSYIQHKPNLATVATSGSYNDLSNKPFIPAAQVNSDWNSSSGVSEILNKPNLATVATSGSYNDLSNKPTIPPAQVNSDWNAISGVAQILNKPNLATVATSGSYNDLSNKPEIPDGVPEVTSSDNDKVLTASYEGGVGSYSWQPASGGIGTVTYINYGDSSVDFNDIVSKVTSGEIVIVKYNVTIYPDQASIYVLSEIQSGSDGITALFWSRDVRYPNSFECNIATIELNNSQYQKWKIYDTNLNPIVAGSGITITKLTGINNGQKEISVTNPIPNVTSSDNSKVLTASYVGDVASYSWENAPGGVPTVTSSDDGKVLTASYSGGVASYAWESTGSGSANVECIEFNDLSTKFPNGMQDLATYLSSGKGVILHQSTSTTEQFYYLEEYVSTSSLVYMIPIAQRVSPTLLTLRLNTLRESNGSWYINSANFESYVFDPYKLLVNTASAAHTDSLTSGETFDTNQLVLVKEDSVYPVRPSVTLYRCISGYTASSNNTISGDTTHWEQIFIVDELQKLQKFPDSSISDAGKILTVNNSGIPEWDDAPACTITDVTVNGTSVVSQGVAAVTVPVIGTITL